MGWVDRMRGRLADAGTRVVRMLPGQGDHDPAREQHTRVRGQDGPERDGARPFLHGDGRAGSVDAPAAGVATPDPRGGAAVQVRPRTHTLAPGESLDDVARRYAVTVAEIVELNGLEDPELVFAGQVFKVERVSR